MRFNFLKEIKIKDKKVINVITREIDRKESR